jgi:transaldolase
MKTNPLKQLGTLGQSVWLDFIKRSLITSGDLKKLIDEDGLKGMTSNPALFEKAMEGHEYDDDIKKLAKEGKNVKEIYEILSVKDVSSAADVFRPIYDSIDTKKDGYVSLEVNPHLARDTKGTIEEGRQLWKLLNRPNVFIKVPATKEGLPAITQLISEGINVNVTLLFGLPRYREVVNAYISGIEKRLEQGKPVDHVASVASFFLSRIDVLLDPVLEKMIAEGGQKAETAKKMLGQVAIASAKMAYQIYKEMYANPRFKALSQKGAQPQKLLWASTGTKNPNYSPVKYVEALIGKDTVNTMPPETLEEYRKQGKPELRLEKDIDQASWVIKNLPTVNIDLDKATQQLEDEGIEKFNKPFDKLLETLKKATQKLSS